MSEAPSIQLSRVRKRYWKIEERSLLRSVVPIGRPRRKMIRALRDINLRVEPGETIGVIGRNGAGKSTLLRLLAGVTQPTAGTVITRGRIAPLLSVGVGFHQEMTGRENIYINGMLLGLRKPEIAARFHDIVDFADLSEFVDTPVKFYSSGMFMRLGFSVAIHVDPDVLLVDEVLAVGDLGFQLKCFDRMRALQREGTTIVFVSHSMHAIHLLCPRVVLVHHGRIAVDGPTESAIARYHEVLAAGDDEQEDATVRVIGRQLLVDGSRPMETVNRDQTMTYRMRLRFEQPVDGPQVCFRVLAEDGTLAYSMWTTIGDRWRSFSAFEEALVEVKFRPRFGGGGTYRISTQITNDGASRALYQEQDGPTFFVAPQVGVRGPADLDAAIVVNGEVRTNHRPVRFESRPTSADGG